ncbi:Bsp6I family type II restriction endonuclease [uncultured Methanobrevibacter sp.]|uniref:Bsp6I family type II restriction endonuclease n=1 Tax=uncultured Methanobrevibacter sp. TaxID=253161 RepID=UPI0026E0EEE2|nr:Bsp6I family type II restriction endonuclease [uncultured Methanobrevibacter sp.]
MLKEMRELILEGNTYTADVEIIEKTDKKNLAEMYSLWNSLSSKLSSYGCRRINFPEISELIFCLIYDCWRVNNVSGIGKHSSFDCYNPKNHSRIQIKATSVEDDLTSFGPKSVWDELYFMDFFSNNCYDGSFNVYLIPNEDIYNFKLNKNQTFVDQQKEGRRPRFHIKKGLIKPLEIKPIGCYNIFDL